jgi:hypothetical protein
LKEIFTVPRNDLYHIDTVSHINELFPPSDEKPVVAAINPLLQGLLERYPLTARKLTFLFQVSGP